MKNIISSFLIAVFLLGVVSPAGFARPAYAEEHAKKKKEADPNAPHPEFEYVEMEPMSLPIITTKGLTQQVTFLVSLEVPFGENEAVSVYIPRLMDAYLQDLYGAIGAGYGMMQGGVVDVKQLKQRLTSVTEKVLGPEHKVNDVLLKVVQQHKL